MKSKIKVISLRDLIIESVIVLSIFTLAILIIITFWKLPGNKIPTATLSLLGTIFTILFSTLSAFVVDKRQIEKVKTEKEQIRKKQLQVLEQELETNKKYLSTLKNNTDEYSNLTQEKFDALVNKFYFPFLNKMLMGENSLNTNDVLNLYDFNIKMDYTKALDRDAFIEQLPNTITKCEKEIEYITTSIDA